MRSLRILSYMLSFLCLKLNLFVQHVDISDFFLAQVAREALALPIDVPITQ